ncbi:hypothetical protein ASPZODRAFT_61127 [Penicilliopsis zonata CBS 506.65]|uniref:cyclin-dependent kinase n=1 Tax=Penicilliopsis zonata CBS 506.65 TaxID=1073090 RepID=A0A1L9SPF5_9EURO|nr:hypothetical protein ASPZODRAFT_61127 [Penicilliopsis zonata CBS 506.65]OJJ48944.1 hypothetical protein ASPZODRAFT_61127 [Penicilliopsis zonata CBS 506.65]
MSSTRPIQSVVNESTRSPSPPRPIPSFDAENSTVAPDGEAFPMHGMRVSDAHSGQRSRPPRPHGGNRQYSTSPQYVTSNSSYQGSPPPHSPYSGGRGSWNGQSYHGQHGHSPPYRQNSYSAQGGSQNSYYQNNQSSYNGPGNSTQQPFSGPSYRGGHSNYRGNHPNQGPDRRFGTHGSQGFSNGPPQRGRGHFSNLQWTASGSRGRGDQRSPLTSHNQPPASPSQPASSGNKMSPSLDDDDRPFRPSSKDLPVEEEGPKTTQDLENGDDLRIPPPVQQSNQSETPNKGGKFSFAFKAKTTPVAVPKPVPDLAQRMQVREPPPRAAEPPQRSRMPLGPPPKFRHDTRFDPRDRDRNRDRTRDRERDRGRERPPREREDRREFREPRGPREPRDRRHPRRDDRRFNQQFEKKNERRHEMPLGRHRELSPEPPLEPARPTKILTRVKPRPTLSEEFSQSDSVYFRKPGNESVIGAGTYGKVFKAIHIYTKKMVALKKIRMEGEKDGFPVTAVREIKLLQHLRNPNVVSLLEVMVEKNECFMVFEYLSHDLTGLINHPTFTLTEAHKKNLAQQMFAGLEYLHHRGVLHRDIKAANILISNTGLLKFADFGLARFFSKSRELDYTNRVVTIWYRPPELLLGETRYGPAVDVWSAACVYIELFTKKAVFPGEGGEISQLDKLYNCLGTPTRAEWPDIVEMPWFELMRPTERKKRIFEDLYRSILSPAALDMVSQILSYDPAKRPSAEQVLQHPYFVSEEPSPQQAIELQNIEGDWHEFESKALRKEKDKEARRAEYQKEKEKRKATTGADSQGERDSKRAKQDADSSQHV